MIYLFRIIKIILWGLMNVFIPTAWLLVNTCLLIWYGSTKHCFKITEEGWMDNCHWIVEDWVHEVDEQTELNGVVYKTWKQKHKIYHYKTPLDMLLDRRTYTKI